MNLDEAAKWLGISKLFLSHITDKETLSVIECMNIKNKIAHDTLELREMFYTSEQREAAIIDELIELLD